VVDQYVLINFYAVPLPHSISGYLFLSAFSWGMGRRRQAPNPLKRKIHKLKSVQYNYLRPHIIN